MPIFTPVMDRIVRTGSLTIVDADGRSHEFGDGSGTPITVRLTDRALHWQLAVNPELYFGEGYVDGTIVFENGTLYDFLDTVGRSMRLDRAPLGPAFGRWLLAAKRRIQQE